LILAAVICYELRLKTQGQRDQFREIISRKIFVKKFKKEMTAKKIGEIIKME